MRHSTIVLILLFFCLPLYSQEIRRPTADSDPGGATLNCNVTNIASTAMPDSYDAGGESTLSSLTASASQFTSYHAVRLFSSWQTASGGYTSLNLKVRSGGDIEGAGGITAIEYSTNAGSSWTTLRNDGEDYSATTDSIALSAGQNLANLRVRVCAAGLADWGIATLDVWDIRTEGTLAPGGKLLITSVTQREMEQNNDAQ
jgi:hypothetical protein